MFVIPSQNIEEDVGVSRNYQAFYRDAIGRLSLSNADESRPNFLPHNINIFEQSDNPDQDAWSTSGLIGVTYEPETVEIPGHGQTGCRVYTDGNYDNRYLRQEWSGISLGDFYLSFKFKAGTIGDAYVTMFQSGGPGFIFQLRINLETGAVIEELSSQGEYEIESLGSDWYELKYWMEKEATTGTGIFQLYYPDVDHPATEGDIYVGNFFLRHGAIETDYSRRHGDSLITFDEYVFKGMLIEPASSNLYTYSNTFSNAAWTKNNSAINSDSAATPYVEYMADEIECSSDGDFGIERTIAITGNVNHFFWLRKGTISIFDISFTISTPSAGLSISIDLENLSTTYSDYADYLIIEEYAEGWWKISLKDGQFTSTGNLTFEISGNGISGDTFFIAMAQLENIGEQTSYIENAGSVNTRLADSELVYSGGELIFSNVPSNDETPWDNVSTYSDGDRVEHAGYIWESSADVPADVEPGTEISESPYWVEVSPTNRWNLFDRKYTKENATTNDQFIHFIVNPSGLVTLLGLTNLQGTKSRITIWDSANSEIISDVDYYLYDEDSINSPFSYYFGQKSSVENLIVDEITAFPNYYISVTIENENSFAQCGKFHMGQSENIGDALENTKVELLNLNPNERNAFGQIRVNESARQINTMTVDVLSETPQSVNMINSLFKRLAGNPALFIADKDKSITVMYAYRTRLTSNIVSSNNDVTTITVEEA